jgi:hypothetical protein
LLPVRYKVCNLPMNGEMTGVHQKIMLHIYNFGLFQNLEGKQVRQCTYNITVGRVRVTVVVAKLYVLHILRV